MSICIVSKILKWVAVFLVGVLLIVVGLGKACKKILGVRASAPAFVVVNIFYVWVVYLVVIRPGNFTSFLDQFTFCVALVLRFCT